jgi:16S rRNA (guanine527-N7)-methyltransferase
MTGPTIGSLEEVAGPVSRETFLRLVAFRDLFLKWSARINLAAPSTLNDIWHRHILDSAQLIGLAPEAHNWLDLGSGGGFPGAVISIMIHENPLSRVDLVESNRKKAAFLQSALGPLGQNIYIHPSRIEALYGTLPAPDVVTARALAPLPLLLRLAAPWLAGGARALFHKGRDYRREVEESAAEWSFDLIERPSRADPEGVVLDIRNLKARHQDRPSTS